MTGLTISPVGISFITFPPGEHPVAEPAGTRSHSASSCSSFSHSTFRLSQPVPSFVFVYLIPKLKPIILRPETFFFPPQKTSRFLLHCLDPVLSFLFDCGIGYSNLLKVELIVELAPLLAQVNSLTRFALIRMISDCVLSLFNVTTTSWKRQYG